jgi:hypothetical protein
LKRNESLEVSENQKVMTGYPNAIDRVKDPLFSFSSQALTHWKTMSENCITIFEHKTLSFFLYPSILISMHKYLFF